VILIAPSFGFPVLRKTPARGKNSGQCFLVKNFFSMQATKAEKWN
jgi:hypothetical protein